MKWLWSALAAVAVLGAAAAGLQVYAWSVNSAGLREVVARCQHGCAVITTAEGGIYLKNLEQCAPPPAQPNAEKF